jgi:hypothetical protein
VLNRLTSEYDDAGKDESGKPINPFTKNLRVMSGASGGMVGASFYNIQKLSSLNSKPPATAAFDWISKDHLSPVLRRWAFHDWLWDILPLRNEDDRGRALETSFTDTWPGTFGDTFVSSLGNVEQNATVPALIFSPMLVEDGRRILISNLDLSGCAATELDSISQKKDPYASYLDASGIELRELAPAQFNGLKLVTAARMNASYPFITPAGTLGVTLPGNAENPPMRLRVVDAGYYDNFGVNILSTWLFRNSKFLNNTQILYIQIRLTPVYRDGRRFIVNKPEFYRRGIEWLWSPPESFWQALWQSMLYRNNEDIAHLGAVFKENFTTAVLECPEKMPLNWALTNEESESFENWAYYGYKTPPAETVSKRVDISEEAKVLHDIRIGRKEGTAPYLNSKSDDLNEKLKIWMNKHFGMVSNDDITVSDPNDHKEETRGNADYLAHQFDLIRAFVNKADNVKTDSADSKAK